MNIFIDEYGKIFCNFKSGIYSEITKEYFKKMKESNVIKSIEFALGGKNERHS